MKHLLVTAAVIIASQLGLANLASAADTEAKKPPTAQQQRMRDCNKDATGMKGQERKDFMKACLSGKPTAPAAAAQSDAKTAQQQKMKDCNAEAKTKSLTGDARKAFMSGCLKN